MKEILIEVDKCLGCKSCEIACAVGHSLTKNLLGSLFEAYPPQKRVYVEAANGIAFPVQCRHCVDPSCERACMAGALKRNPVSGLVDHDSNRCVGCWMCVMVCPFGALVQDKHKEKVIKCDRCSEKEKPECVEACPTGAIKYITVDSYSKDKRTSYLTNFVLQEEGK